MHCIETSVPWRNAALAAAAVVSLSLTGCSVRSLGSAALPATPAVPAGNQPATPSSSAPKPAPLQAAPVARAPLPAPATARTWDEYRVLAAHRIVAANPERTYMGEVPEPLLAIPVLEIELNANGSLRRVDVLRHPSQANDTTQLAIDAVRRAAPFGDVSRLPKPWKFSEVFLFGDDRRFKPRTLDR